jgi:hypothetical protein
MNGDSIPDLAIGVPNGSVTGSNDHIYYLFLYDLRQEFRLDEHR